MKRIQLFNGQGNEMTIDIVAFIEEGTGDLVIEGYDLGPGVEKFWGESDYEYWLRIAKDHKAVLLQSFNKKSKPYKNQAKADEALLKFIAKNFNTDKAVSLLKKYCEANHVLAVLSSYA